jgi:hypothetical protein
LSIDKTFVLKELSLFSYIQGAPQGLKKKLKKEERNYGIQKGLKERQKTR